MHYYNHHLGDYAKDTGHLSLAEHGAYRMLLDHYYSTEKPLPLNADAVCRICRATTRLERDAVTSVLAQFFTASDEGYTHKRVERELEANRRLRERNMRNGSLGGRPKQTQEKPSGLFLGSISETQTKAYPTTNNQQPNVLLEKEPKGADAQGERKKQKLEDQEDFEAACRVTLDSANHALLQAWEEWQAYRQRRHKERGQDRLRWTLRAAQLSAKQILQAAELHTPQVVADRIASAVIGDWQGLNFDKLQAPDANGHHSRNGTPTGFEPRPLLF